MVGTTVFIHVQIYVFYSHYVNLPPET